MVIKLGTVGTRLGHSWGTVGAKKLKTLGHSWGTVGTQLGYSWGTRSYLGHNWDIVEAQSRQNQLGHCWGTVEAQLGHNLRTDDRKVSLGTVEAHLGHIFLLGTVGAGLRII